MIGSNIKVFCNNNVRKGKGNNPKTKVRGDTNRKNNLGIEANIIKKIRTDNLGPKTNANAEADKKNMNRQFRNKNRHKYKSK